MKKNFFVMICLLTGCIFAESLPIIYFLQPIEITQNDSGLEKVDCIYVINLKERPERWELLQSQMKEQNLNANRIDAVNGWKIPSDHLQKIADSRLHSSQIIPGEIGCMLSHLSIYQDAFERGFEVIWICEDDIKFNRKVSEISSLIEELFWIDPDWDLLYTEHTMFGSTLQRCRPGQKPYNTINEDVSLTLARTHGRFGTHSMILSRKGLEKILSYYSTRSFWSPIDVDLHYIGLREYSIKKGFTSIESKFPSDTQPISSLRNGK